MASAKQKDKSFPMTVWSGLAYAKHRKRMKEAIWLYIVFLDWTTKEEDDTGIVLGGKPITHAMVCDRLDISKAQYHRHIDALKKYNYIKADRTRNGLIVKITKSKKWRKYSKMSTLKDSRSIKNDTSEQSRVLKNEHSQTPEYSKMRPRVLKNEHSEYSKMSTPFNKEDLHTVDITVDSKETPNSDESEMSTLDESQIPEGEIRQMVINFYDYQYKRFPKQLRRWKNKTDAKKMIEAGIVIFDKLKRLDGYTIEDITTTLNWAVKDSFWMSQVQSLGGLRVKKKNGNTKFANIYTAMTTRRKGQRTGSNKVTTRFGSGRHTIPNEDKQRKQYVGL